MDTPPAGALDRIREEIDAIDDAMLALLAKRFAAVEEVKRIKAAERSHRPIADPPGARGGNPAPARPGQGRIWFRPNSG